MKKILLATLLSLSAMTANASEDNKTEIKIEAPADVRSLFFTEAHKTDLTQYCTNAAANSSAGVFIPAAGIMRTAIVYPDAPLAKKYFPEEAIRAAQEAYLQLENRKDIDIKSKFSTAALWGIKILDEKLGKDNDKLFDFLKNIYNDVAKACNDRYTGGKREMFMIIKEGYQK